MLSGRQAVVGSVSAVRQTILPLLSVTASSAAVRFAPVIWLS